MFHLTVTYFLIGSGGSRKWLVPSFASIALRFPRLKVQRNGRAIFL